MEKLNQSKSATLYTAQFNELVSAISASGVTYDVKHLCIKYLQGLKIHLRTMPELFRITDNLDKLQQEAEKLDDLMFRHARSSKNVTLKPRSPTPSSLDPVAKPLAKTAKEPSATSPSHESMPPLKSILKKTKLPSTQALSFKNNCFEPLTFDEPTCPLTSANSDSTTTDPTNEFDHPRYTLFSMKNHHSSAFSDAPGLLICQGTIQDHPVSILIDSGATPSFIHASLPFIQDSSLQAQDYKIRLADKSLVQGKRTKSLLLKLQGTSFTDSRSYTAMPSLAYNIILGNNFLNNYNPEINWPSNTVKIGPHLWTCTLPRPLPEVLSVEQFDTLPHKKPDPEMKIGLMICQTFQDQPDQTPDKSTKPDQSPDETFKPTTASSNAADPEFLKITQYLIDPENCQI
ncbi:hypothetical protein HDU78_003028 [Chytriomyces hyalinus]|nr:hypothetical protein HDU78_003028 [Chytriomyces hyalinus]